VRAIFRGNLDKPVEFRAKLSLSLNGDGVACVDHLRWDSFHEGGNAKSQVESYRLRHGHYPQVVLTDPV
jgi:transposase, IS5 family